MRPAQLLAALLLSLAYSLMAGGPAIAQTVLMAQAGAPGANVNARFTQLRAGIHLIQAELAATPAERQQGLMQRQALATNTGMLFVFGQDDMHCFWMKNTPLPLSIAFIDTDGTIVNILDMAPHDESSHCPAKPVRFALEMEQGWFADKGITAGARLAGQPFKTARPAPAKK